MDGLQALKYPVVLPIQRDGAIQRHQACGRYQRCVLSGRTAAAGDSADPFLAKANPFRFSTKYQDNETDLWTTDIDITIRAQEGGSSRDPLSEKASRNLYTLLDNNPIGRIDKLGRCKCGPDVTSALNVVLARGRGGVQRPEPR